MATYEKIKLSGANTSNAPIALGPFGTTVHMTGTSSTIFDEVWLWISNQNNVSNVFDVYIDSSLSITVEVPARSIYLVLPGHPLRGSGSSSTGIDVQDMTLAGLPVAFGYVNRITP